MPTGEGPLIPYNCGWAMGPARLDSAGDAGGPLLKEYWFVASCEITQNIT